MNKIALFALLLGIATSCDTNIVQSDMMSIDNAVWNKNEPVVFTFPQQDSTKAYDLFLTVRNTNEYGYNNLFLITRMEYPNGKVITDTLEYKMANPDGFWLGKGIASTKESKLWFKENIHLDEVGTYNLMIGHAVRNNGEVKGVSNLEGISDVGYSIEELTKE